MPDVLHWLGITRIHRFASMSDMKCDALIRQGITIDERVLDPRRADPGRRPRRDRCQDRGRLLRRRRPAPRRRRDGRTGPQRVTAAAVVAAKRVTHARAAQPRPRMQFARRPELVTPSRATARTSSRRPRRSPASTARRRCASAAAWFTASSPTAARPISRSTRASLPAIAAYVARGDARGLSRPGNSLSQPLAPFLRGRHRPLGQRSRNARRRPHRAGAHRGRPRDRQRAARRRRRRRLALSRAGHRARARALRGACGREPRHVPRRRLLRRSPINPVASTRSAWSRSTPARWRAISRSTPAIR